MVGPITTVTSRSDLLAASRAIAIARLDDSSIAEVSLNENHLVILTHKVRTQVDCQVCDRTASVRVNAPMLCRLLDTLPEVDNVVVTISRRELKIGTASLSALGFSNSDGEAPKSLHELRSHLKALLPLEKLSDAELRAVAILSSPQDLIDHGRLNQSQRILEDLEDCLANAASELACYGVTVDDLRKLVKERFPEYVSLTLYAEHYHPAEPAPETHG